LITVRIEKKCRFVPVIYIMNDVIPTCFSGENDSEDSAAVRLRYSSGVSSTVWCAVLVDDDDAAPAPGRNPGGNDVLRDECAGGADVSA
jgi:hypothetical protein